MKQIRKNSMQAWVLATRPKTLTGALIPVLIGSSLAFMDGGFHWQSALACCLFAFLMQIAANLINDLFDFLKGTDRDDRLGPERACAQGWITPNAMKWGVGIALFLACSVGCSLLFYTGWQLVWLGLLCVFFAFFYTTGPYPLSYNGWGDALVLLFFGFVPVGGTYYVQTHHWNGSVGLASLICGLTVDTLLVVNNYRDRDADAQSGKRTVVVRFGEPFGRYLYLLLGVVASILCLFFAFKGPLWAALLPQIYLFFHFRTWQKMVRIHAGKALNSVLGDTSRNMLLMALLLSLGLLIG